MQDPVLVIVEQLRWGLAALLISLAVAGKRAARSYSASVQSCALHSPGRSTVHSWTSTW